MGDEHGSMPSALRASGDYPTAPLLYLRDFGVCAGKRVLLSGIDLEVPHRGVLALMGPGSSGKSTLLRAMCGVLAADPAIRFRGEAYYRGRRLGVRGYPVLVRQKADILLGTVFDCLAGPLESSLPERDKRLRIEVLLRYFGRTDLLPRLTDPVIDLDAASRRLLLLIRGVVGDPRLLCVDEPTADLGGDDAHRLLDCLAQIAKRHAVVFVTHNQQHARRIASSIALINDRTLVAQHETEDFFRCENPAVQTFVRTGGLPIGSDAPFSWDEVSESEIHPFVSELRGPVGFRWLEAGRLGGVPMPGVVKSIDEDLALLKTVGVRVVISLNEEAPVAAIEDAGFVCVHRPFPDRGPPTLEVAVELCRMIADHVAAGVPVAVHCRAGLGRTGTILGCYLISRGTSASFALRHLRSVDPGWVQSATQEQFLTEFEQWLEQRPSAADSQTALTPQPEQEN
jgi:atypical dual specificity phosphatase